LSLLGSKLKICIWSSCGSSFPHLQEAKQAQQTINGMNTHAGLATDMAAAPAHGEYVALLVLLFELLLVLSFHGMKPLQAEDGALAT
jgi:hypothetical protein